MEDGKCPKGGSTNVHHKEYAPEEVNLDEKKLDTRSTCARTAELESCIAGKEALKKVENPAGKPGDWAKA